ncbi:MAG: ABC transporter permease [Nanoarchaeota archaeon]|jgi:ABC-type multidrug transport system permease subunit|nr:ABC transporter permease [Nanoarchaeota archaeon]
MSIYSLFLLVKKDLKLFFRSRVSSAVIIILPVLIVVFAGFAFNSTQLSNINLAIYPESYGDMTKNILDGFSDNNFTLTVSGSISECIDSVKFGESQICIEFPKSMNSSKDLDKIVFYIDYSRVNLANTLVNIADSNVDYESTSLSVSMVRDLITTIDTIKNQIPPVKSSLSDGINLVNKGISDSSKIEISVEDVVDIIDSLEIFKDSLSENDTDLKLEIADIILSLKEVELAETELKSDLNDALKIHKDSRVKLDEADNKLESLSSSLNSKKIQDVEEIVSPINTEIVPINPDSKNRDYLIPNLLALISMFGSILLGSTFVLKNKKTRAFFRNFVTPTKGVVFILSTYLASFIIVAIQFIFVFLGIRYVLQLENFILSWELVSILFVIWTVFIFIGMFIGYLFRSEETIVFSAMIIGAVFMFFSNTILPLENISSDFLKYAVMNPLVVAHMALKKIILFELDFSFLKEEFLILGIFATIFFFLSVVFRNMTKRIL